mmetsp:Transcript_33133/g.64219  ORF Transcript_33133/g.64219 Transcript_33133/m.64219 type:complete len:475 (+) Transcript_33133:76-1500(+)
MIAVLQSISCGKSFFVFIGCFCMASCNRDGDLRSRHVEMEVDGDDGVHNMVLHNTGELRLAAVGNNFESYIENFERAVGRVQERAAKKGIIMEKNVVDGYGPVGDGKAWKFEFCPVEWLPMVRKQAQKRISNGKFGVVYIGDVSCDANPYQMAFKVQIDNSKNKSAEEGSYDQALWLAEANLGKALDHPYIIKTFDSGNLKNGMGVIAMEFANSGDLNDHFSGYPNQPAYANVNRAEVAKFTLQILLGLKYMHSKGIVHADFKPEQVVLQCGSQSACEARIADFGLAVEATQQDPKPGFRGSPYYLAPEIANEEKIYPASDMWALGVSIHEMLNKGHHLVTGATVDQLTHNLKLMSYLAASNLSPSSLYNKTLEQSNTAVNQLLFHLLKIIPQDRISAADAIEFAEKWAQAEGVDQGTIDAIMLKGQMPSENEIHGAKPPVCWQICKGLKCGENPCVLQVGSFSCSVANHFGSF